MDDFETTLRSFADGGLSVESLQFAAEATPGNLATRTLGLLTEFENSGSEFDELELRRRAARLHDS